MLTRLLVLWLLSEGPVHGYQIKRALEDEGMVFWFPVEFASIYSVLRTLSKAGYVEPLRAERIGGRPERIRYRITRKGRRYYAELLRHAWREPSSPGEPFQLALAAQADLDPVEVASLAEERSAALQARVARCAALARAAPARELAERTAALARAELRWLRDWSRAPVAKRS